MRELIGKFESMNQPIANLVVSWFTLLAIEPLLQSRYRVHERADIDRRVRCGSARPVILTWTS
jgi:hypothetical protein